MLPDLRPNEDVVAYTRQHWSRPASRAVLPLLLLLAVIAVGLTWRAVPPAWPPPWLTVSTGGLIALAALLVLWLVWIYADWVDDALIVTNQRIIWLQKTAFVSESRREIPLHRVQNVSVSADGLLPNWFGYGTLLVEAAGSQPIVAPMLMQAHEVRRRIFVVQTEQRRARQQVDDTSTEAAVRAALGLTAEGPPPPPMPMPATEQVGGLLVWHRHWWFLITAVVRPFLLVVLVGVAGGLITRLTVVIDEVGLLLLSALFGLGLVGLVAMVWQVLVWREDRYILDGDRLLDVEQAPFRMRRLVKETLLGRVQDVSYRIPHPLAHLLNYGDVLIQTAGETQHFTFDGVTDPRAVHAEISRRLVASREAEGEARSRQQREDILDILRAYHEVTQEQQTGPMAPPPPPAAGPQA